MTAEFLTPNTTLDQRYVDLIVEHVDRARCGFRDAYCPEATGISG
jgi:hypothetical protein